VVVRKQIVESQGKECGLCATENKGPLKVFEDRLLIAMSEDKCVHGEVDGLEEERLIEGN
jgi:hypothetical protein